MSITSHENYLAAVERANTISDEVDDCWDNQEFNSLIDEMEKWEKGEDFLTRFPDLKDLTL